jgi:hypothetical protein
MKDKETRVVIVVNLAGRSYTKEYPFGQKANVEFNRRFIHENRKEPPTHYTATLFVIAERRSQKSSVLVQLDSLDTQVSLDVKEWTKLKRTVHARDLTASICIALDWQPWLTWLILPPLIEFGLFLG